MLATDPRTKCPAISITLGRRFRAASGPSGVLEREPSEDMVGLPDACERLLGGDLQDLRIDLRMPLRSFSRGTD